VSILVPPPAARPSRSCSAGSAPWRPYPRSPPCSRRSPRSRRTRCSSRRPPQSRAWGSSPSPPPPPRARPARARLGHPRRALWRRHEAELLGHRPQRVCCGPVRGGTGSPQPRALMRPTRPPLLQLPCACSFRISSLEAAATLVVANGYAYTFSLGALPGTPFVRLYQEDPSTRHWYRCGSKVTVPSGCSSRPTSPRLRRGRAPTTRLQGPSRSPCRGQVRRGGGAGRRAARALSQRLRCLCAQTRPASCTQRSTALTQ